MIKKKKDEYAKTVKEINKKFKKKDIKKQKIGKELKFRGRGGKRSTKKLRMSFSEYKFYRLAKNFGLLFMIIGIGFLINSGFLEIFNIGFLLSSVILNLKFGIVFISVGFFLYYIFTTPSTKKEIKYKAINARQITFAVSIWILAIFFVTFDIDIDIFLILIIIGILTIKELANEFMDVKLKNRMKFLSYTILIIFFLVIGQRIINILNI